MIRQPVPLLAAVASVLAASAAVAGSDPYRTWSVYNGGPEALKYSSLDQINRGNVQPPGGRPGATAPGTPTPRPPDSPGLSPLQANPIIVGDTLYSLGQNNKVFALDAATGKPRWVHRSARAGRAHPARRWCTGRAPTARTAGSCSPSGPT